MSLFRRKYSLG